MYNDIFNELHILFKKNIKVIAESTNVNPEIFQKNIKKKVQIINEKASKPRYVNLKAYACNLIMLFAIAIAIVPLMIHNATIEDTINYTINISKRKRMVEEINLYTMESIIQDRSIYGPGDSEKKLNFVINDLK
ncbi:hypothetical protein PIROE2DRAFT_16390, partial [Piromyces sp. E2]